MSLVYCPRTHNYFHSGEYPLADMLAANVNVCLGTDSRASNPSLSLWEEMQFVAKKHPQVSGEGVLYLGTMAGAIALQRENDYGSIAAGKIASLAMVEIPQQDSADPHDLLFTPNTTVRTLRYSD